MNDQGQEKLSFWQQKKLDWQAMTPEERKKFWIMTAGIAAFLVIVVVGIAFATHQNTPQPTQVTKTVTPTATPSPTPPVEQASLLNGVVVPYALSIKHPLAVMIENTPDARPQSGLNEASIVYEAIAEGGITRFMAIFGPTLPDKVGPVRSSRPYYVMWAEEYSQLHSAFYVHVGGSPDALNLIKSDNVYDMNQFDIGAAAFQRIPKAGVAIEHTMYGYPDKLYAITQQRGWPTNIDSTFRPWKFKDDADITTRPDTQTISIPFSGPLYAVKYVYDKASNTYKRYVANVPHVDAAGKQIAAKTVAVEFTDYKSLDSHDRQDVRTTGEGPAKVFEDGKVIEAKWSRGNGHARTVFTDAATGQEIQFNRGQIWVEVPKTGTTVTVQ